MSQILDTIDWSSNHKICAVIPTYNNCRTIGEVIVGVKKYIKHIIVIDDGSTDDTKDIINTFDSIEIITFSKNKGKGAALRSGFKSAISQGFEYAITIDSDGQHYPENIPDFLEQIRENPDSLIIGSRNIEADGMPSKNTFANKFSNFWFWAETNQKLPDTQSGFRLYPIKLYKNTIFFTNKFEFEIEVLVRSAWSNIKIIPIPVKVYYAPEGERITHFRPLPDFTRISVLNTVLVLITLLYILPLKALKYLTENKFTKVVKEQVMLHNENTLKLSTAIGFGMFMGIAPIWGFQMVVAALLAHFFRLNKIIVLTFSNISLPPFIPFIIYLSYEMGGLVMNNPQKFSTETIEYLKNQILNGGFYEALNEFGYSILQYVIGSLIFGILLGLMATGLSYLIITISKRKPVTHE